MEQVGRVVFVFQRQQPVVVAAKCLPDAIGAFFVRIVDIEAFGEWLDLLPEIAHIRHIFVVVLTIEPAAAGDKIVFRIAM